MIAFDLQTFQQDREGGNVTGVIFLELNGGAFPERGWTDFPVIILGWLSDALLQLEVPTRREVQWLFMDGPHLVTLTKAEGSVLGRGYDLSQVHSSLLEAAQRVVTHCDQHRMFSNDLEALRDNLQRLKAVQRTGTSRSSSTEILLSVAAVSRR